MVAHRRDLPDLPPVVRRCERRRHGRPRRHHVAARRPAGARHRRDLALALLHVAPARRRLRRRRLLRRRPAIRHARRLRRHARRSARTRHPRHHRPRAQPLVATSTSGSRRRSPPRPAAPSARRYLFRDGRGAGGDEPPNNWESVFGGPAWTRIVEADGTPGQWYLHLFDSSQPDFDWTNEEVREEFRRILRFWLDRGVDGFRVDVAHGMIKADGLPDYTPPAEGGSMGGAGGVVVESNERSGRSSRSVSRRARRARWCRRRVCGRCHGKRRGRCDGRLCERRHGRLPVSSSTRETVGADPTGVALEPAISDETATAHPTGRKTACTRSTATGAPCSTSTPASASSPPRRGSTRSPASRSGCAPTRCTRPSTSPTSRPRGTPRRFARSSTPRSRRVRRRRRTVDLGALEPRRRAPRHAPLGHRGQPAGSRPRSPLEGPARVRAGLRRARAATALMLALPGSVVPLPGRGARPARGHPPARRCPPGPHLVPHDGERYGRDGCRVPMPVGGRGAELRLRLRRTTSWLPQPAQWAELARDRSAASTARPSRSTATPFALRREHDLGARTRSSGCPGSGRGDRRVPQRRRRRGGEHGRRARRAARPATCCSRAVRSTAAPSRATRPPGSAPDPIERTPRARAAGRGIRSPHATPRCTR